MRNIDKIKAMSIDEMAEFITDLIPETCEGCPAWNAGITECGCCFFAIRKWLESGSEAE